MKTIPLSILDLAPIRAGETAADAFRTTLDLARRAERWGYQRYWLAEHHNFPGIASAATAVLIGYVEARRLFRTLQQGFLNLVRGTPGRLAPPVEPDEMEWSTLEQAQVERMTRISVVGSPETVRTGVAVLAHETGADEIIVAGLIYEHEAHLRSYEILAQVCELAAQES